MPEKHTAHASPTEKALGLYTLLLFSGKQYSLTNLSRKFGCSKQTVLRMVEHIDRSARTSIKSWLDDGQKWFQVPTPKSRPHVSFSPEEIQRLMLCKELVWRILPQGMRGDIDDALRKSTTLLPDMEDRCGALAHVADVAVKGVVDYTPHQESLDKLLKAINETRALRITYKAARATHSKEHLYAPVRLILYREALYAEGIFLDPEHPDKAKHAAKLALHRMQSVEETDYLRPETTIQEQERNDFGFVQNESFRVKVKFDACVAHYVRERIWSEDQAIKEFKNGKLQLEFTARSEWEVISWVLSFGGSAQLLAPKELMERMREEVEQMSKKYPQRRNKPWNEWE